MAEEHDLTDEQVELLKTVPHLQEKVGDDAAKAFLVACEEIRGDYLSGAAADLEDVAHQLKETTDE